MVRTLAAAAALLALAGGCADGRSAPPTARPASSSTSAPPTSASSVPSTGALSPPSTTTPPSAARPAPSTVPAAPAAAVWVAAEGGRVVARVDPGSGAVASRVAVDSAPHNVAVSPDGVVAATLPAAGRVAVIAGGRSTTVRLGGSPHDVKARTGGFVVANEAGRRLDLLDAAGTPQGSVALEAAPHDVAVAADGATAWVTLDDRGELAVVDLARRERVRAAPIGGRPHDLAFAPDGRLWVTDWDGPLRVVTPDGRVGGSVALSDESHHLAFSADGARVWVSDAGARTLFVVDTAAVAVVARVRLAGAPHHLAVTGGRVLVADNTRGRVVAFDEPTRAPLGEVDVGRGLHGLAAS